MNTENVTPSTIRFLRIDEVKHLVGLSRSQIYKMQREGTFPRSICLSRKAVGWSDQQVREWMIRRVPKAH